MTWEPDLRILKTRNLESTWKSGPRGTLAIRQIQKIPARASVVIMLFGIVLWYYGVAGTFVR